MEELKAGASKPAIIVCSEKGGVRKTSSAIMAGEYLRNERFDVQFIQVDEQTRLQALYRETVTTIGLPSPEKMRGDDLADTKALSPVLAALKRSEMAVSIIDVGANFDRRFFEWSVSMELGKSLNVVGVIPISSDSESHEGGARTAARFAAAFPHNEMVIVVCEDGDRPDSERVGTKSLRPSIRSFAKWIFTKPASSSSSKSSVILVCCPALCQSFSPPVSRRPNSR